MTVPACGAPDSEQRSAGEADAPASVGSASAELRALLDAAWARTLDESPGTRLQEGLPVERLPDLSHAAAEERAAFHQRMSDRAASLDPVELTPDERVSLETLAWEADMAVEGHRYFWLRSTLTPYSSALRVYGNLFPRLPLDDEEDLDRFVALVGRVPEHLRQLDAVTRGQLERGIVVSRDNLAAVVELVRSQGVEPERGPFRLPDSRVSGLDRERVARARARVAALVRDSINPAVAELADFLEGPYARQAPAGVGISQYPGGRDYYLYLTRLHTTMEVTPQEVQRAGRELLAEFQARMAEIRERLGWEGTADEFHRHLKSDPRYFPRTPEEVGERLRAASTRMSESVDAYFASSPVAPWDARRLAPELEPGMTYGYYAPPTATEPHGIYYFNGSSLEERSWLGLTAISLHELIPGHHFQIVRQLESPLLHHYRRNSYYTAFGEGWGSYASFLGREAGVYEDPYSEYGLYILESFLATRLVVDPGMNYFDMTLEEARRFMRQNTLESDTQIASESLRYSTDLPGQGLGYQMGKRKLLELRERAEARLGDRFDIRRFHEVVLGNGSLPMAVLEREVDAWIETEGGP